MPARRGLSQHVSSHGPAPRAFHVQVLPAAVPSPLTAFGWEDVRAIEVSSGHAGEGTVMFVGCNVGGCLQIQQWQASTELSTILTAPCVFEQL